MCVTCLWFSIAKVVFPAALQKIPLPPEKEIYIFAFAEIDMTFKFCCNLALSNARISSSNFFLQNYLFNHYKKLCFSKSGIVLAT